MADSNRRSPSLWPSKGKRRMSDCDNLQSMSISITQPTPVRLHQFAGADSLACMCREDTGLAARALAISILPRRRSDHSLLGDQQMCFFDAKHSLDQVWLPLTHQQRFPFFRELPARCRIGSPRTGQLGQQQRNLSVSYTLYQLSAWVRPWHESAEILPGDISDLYQQRTMDFKRMIPDLPQPKQEVTQSYRCLSDFRKAVWVNVSTRLDFHSAIEIHAQKASPGLHTIESYWSPNDLNTIHSSPLDL